MYNADLLGIHPPEIKEVINFIVNFVTFVKISNEN